jgi:hypothetical protein
VVNFLKPAIANRLVAGITAFTFAIAVMAPPPIYAAGVNLDLAAINFGVKVDKRGRACDPAINIDLSNG